MKQLLRIVGNINLLGNPISLFNDIGDGIIDFYEIPKEGFIQGPLEGSKGIIKGTFGLVGKSFGGVSNSLSKITGSIASGLSELTFDKEYQQKRDI